MLNNNSFCIISCDVQVYVSHHVNCDILQSGNVVNAYMYYA